MKVYQIPVGPMQNFSYIVEDTSTHEAIVIDPSWDLEKLTKTIDEQNLKIKYIVNTHWHDDHTRGNEELSKQLGVKIIQHEASQLKSDLTVSDGDSIEFGSSFLWSIIHLVIQKIVYVSLVEGKFLRVIHCL